MFRFYLFTKIYIHNLIKKMATGIDTCAKTINENRAQMRQVFLDYSLISEYLREEKNVRMVVQGDLGVKDETGLRGVIRCLCQKNKEMNSKIFANKE